METRQSPGMKLYVIVWLGLLLIVGVEVVLTYAHLPVGPQLVIQRSLAHAQPLRRAAAVPTDLVQRPANRLLLDLLQGTRAAASRRAGRDLEILGAQHVTVGQDDGALQRVAELAHVAGPRALQNPLARVLVESQGRAPQLRPMRASSVSASGRMSSRRSRNGRSSIG